MPSLIAFYGEYSNDDVNERLINYCMKSKFAFYYGGSATFMNSTDSIVQQFKNIQDVYNEKDNRPVEHFILSFDDASSRNFTLIDYNVYHISNTISRYIGNRFQNIFSVHKGSEEKDECLYTLMHGPDINPDNLHVHFVVNRVSYTDGTKFYVNKQTYQDILNFARTDMPGLINEKIFKELQWYGPFFKETYIR